jgi:cobalt-zinc-cadmium efflux system membrane fusion protein
MVCRDGLDILMKSKTLRINLLLIALVSMLSLDGCKKNQPDAAAEAPTATTVTPDFNVSSFKVDHLDQFPLFAAVEHSAPTKLVVTGAVNPDIARTVPVISMASGRIISIHARLGDAVRKGQLLLRVRSDDISGAFANYQMAAADEILTRAQWERSETLFTHGAISMNDLQVAKDTDDKAKIAVDTAAEHLRLLGSSVDHPTGIVDIVAPVSGVITDQEVTNAAGVQSLGTSPFTISDLSYVWIVCDVYENDLATVKIGDSAEITLNAYPGKVLQGTISNIGVVLDPNIRTGKVRIEVRNPGLMRLGMFATATFSGQKSEPHTVVPSAAILHLHDRDYVYVPVPDNKFRRVEVISGDNLPGNMQELKAGLQPGQQVVSNALVMQHTVEQ